MTNVPGWLAALAIVVPAATGVLGYWLAGQNEEKRDQRATERELVARQDARVERADDRRHDFQREVLLELQDVLRRHMRSTVLIVMRDKRTLKEQGKFCLVGEELSEESFAAGIDLFLLRERVLDDQLRRELEGFHTQTSKLEAEIAYLKDRPANEAITRLEAQETALRSAHGEVTKRLGELLREELGWIPGTPSG
jgi:hypothetical protein